MFYAWLITQQTREDDLGRFARAAAIDPHFPRRSRQLSIFLTYYAQLPEHRRLVKWAHREWRRSMRRAA